MPPPPGLQRVTGAAKATATGPGEATGPGPELAWRFNGVFAGDVVARKKPAPDIYQLAMQQLGTEPDDTLVIEDSQNGLEAATAAGLRCLVTVNGYTQHECFDGATLVVSHLGDPGNPLIVLQNRSKARPEGVLQLADLLGCLESPPVARGVGGLK